MSYVMGKPLNNNGIKLGTIFTFVSIGIAVVSAGVPLMKKRWAENKAFYNQHVKKAPEEYVPKVVSIPYSQFMKAAAAGEIADVQISASGQMVVGHMKGSKDFFRTPVPANENALSRFPADSQTQIVIEESETNELSGFVKDTAKAIILKKL